MDRRAFFRCAGSTVAVLAANARGDECDAVTDLAEQLEAIRKEHGLPGVAAAIARGKEVIAEGVAGVRRLGGNDKITPGDLFLIGSCTKRMTGLTVCRLVDKGRLTFD